jgi:hypothetical protein
VTIFLRKMEAHVVIEGPDPEPWSNDDDYAVVEGKLIGRVYRDRVPGGETKWRWSLQSRPVVPQPNSGEADTLEEAKAALAERHQRLR